MFCRLDSIDCQHINPPGVQRHHVRSGVSPDDASQLVVAAHVCDDALSQTLLDRHAVPVLLVLGRCGAAQDDDAAGVAETAGWDGPCGLSAGGGGGGRGRRL